MFKPVTADQLSNYDEETIDLYTKRVNDDRLTWLLATVPRRQRHNLPVEVSYPELNPYLVNTQKQRD